LVQLANKIFYILTYSNDLTNKLDHIVRVFNSIKDLKEYWKAMTTYSNYNTIVSIQKFTGIVENLEPIKTERVETIVENDWLGALNGQEPTNEGMGRNTETEERGKETP
jgi:hypothetical protein